MASKEGDGRVHDACMLMDVRLYLLEEGDSVPIKGFVKGNARMTSFASDDPSGCGSHFRA